MILTEGKSLEQVQIEIAATLVKQDGQCMDDESSLCVYGNSKGQHCAVGWLLPEDNDDFMSFEGSVRELINAFDYLGPNDKWIHKNVDLVDTLQLIHDNAREPLFLEDHSGSMKIFQGFINLVQEKEQK